MAVYPILKSSVGCRTLRKRPWAGAGAVRIWPILSICARNAVLHQSPGNHRLHLSFIVTVAILLIELVHQRIQRHRFADAKHRLPDFFIGYGLELRIIHHRQHG